MGPGSPCPVPAGAEVVTVEAGGIRHRIRFSGAELTAPALLAAVSAQRGVADLRLTEPAIEDLVREISTRAR